MYSTEAKIRQEAGFQSSINITSTVVVQYQTRAYNLVRSFVAGRYDITQFTGSLFTGSQAESVLEQCEILIAAGYLEQSQFEGQPRGENSGAKKEDGKGFQEAGIPTMLELHGLASVWQQ